MKASRFWLAYARKDEMPTALSSFLEKQPRESSLSKVFGW